MPRWVEGWLASLIAALIWLPAPSQAAEPTLSVPILLYHRLGPAVTDDMTVTTPVVEAQLKAIQDRGYTVIPLKTLLADLGEPATKLPERSVVIVADDGHRSVYTDLFPLMKRYKVPVTLFIYPSVISNPSASYGMTWEQLAEIKASGLADIQSHTFWHPNFKIDKKRLAPAAYEKFVQDQLVKSKTVLEQKFGGTVDLLAWPFGIHDAELEQAAQKAGYVAAFTIDRRPVTRSETMMALPRFIVTDYDRGARFENLLQGTLK
jgi:peptidoglycan/xylan/chitin deacetylase (PgdA/CDA1 family)